MRLMVSLAKLAWVRPVGITRVHRRPDRKPGDQPAAGDAVDHREFLSHAGRRIVERQRVAHHADCGVGGAAGQRGGNQVRRRHQAVAIGVVLVHANGVEADLGGVFQFVHEVVVHEMSALWIKQRGMDIHPDGRIGFPEVVRQFRIGHQVEPHQLHGRPPVSGYRSVWRDPLWYVNFQLLRFSASLGPRMIRGNGRPRPTALAETGI